MADHERDPDGIIGRNADEAGAQVPGYGDRGPYGANGDAVADQLNQTTSEDAGGNVSGTGAGEQCEDLDIVFEQEGDEDAH